MALEKPFCIRCQEDFPVAQEPTHWHMGQLRKAKRLPLKIYRKLHVDHEDIRGEPYVCGNCYFDLMDDED